MSRSDSVSFISTLSSSDLSLEYPVTCLVFLVKIEFSLYSSLLEQFLIIHFKGFVIRIVAICSFWDRTIFMASFWCSAHEYSKGLVSSM